MYIIDMKTKARKTLSCSYVKVSMGYGKFEIHFINGDIRRVSGNTFNEAIKNANIKIEDIDYYDILPSK